MIGLIGGYNLENIIENKKWRTIKTSFGKPSSKIAFGEIAGKKIAFISRHGEKHSIPPHMINHHANIKAFYDLGVKYIICIAAVGIISPKIKIKDFILPDDFIDFSFRPITFFNKFGNEQKHAFLGNPYSQHLRTAILKAGKILKIKIRSRGVYANMPGPRLETQAELKMLKNLGSDIVGMTNAPEIILARELGLEAATIAIGTNYTFGISESDINLKKIIRNKEKNLKDLLAEAIKLI